MASRPEKDIKKLRYVVVKGVAYLRAEDVADLIRELGGGEETDVRNRLNEAAENVLDIFVRKELP